MRFVDGLTPLRLYPAKKRVFLPVNAKKKKFGSAIFLMGQTQEANERMINLPYLYATYGLFRAYYIDRNVQAYIDSRDKDELANELDEEGNIEESAKILHEGITHTSKELFTLNNAYALDESVIGKVYTKDATKVCMSKLGMSKCPVKNIVVNVYHSKKDLQDSIQDVYWTEGEVYSYTEGNEINVLSIREYDEKTMDGPYSAYLLHELIYCLIINEYPNINRKIATYTAIALSGQLEWFRGEAFKHPEKDPLGKDRFEYYDDEKAHMKGLYIADVIYTLYVTKGSIGIKKFLEGDFGSIRDIIGRRTYLKINALYRNFYHEAKLPSKARNELPDSEFGIPSKRAYPLNDKSHVLAAIRMFNHVSEEDEKQLASNIKKKIKAYGMADEVKVSEKNKFSKYYSSPKKESAGIDNEEKASNIEYDSYNCPMIGDHDKDYYSVLQILDTFDEDEFKKVSFYPTYKNNEHIEKRIVSYSPEGIPMGFMDVYHFPSTPKEAQITTGVAKPFRGQGICQKMFEELITSGWAEENDIERYIWHVHPGNDASAHIAINCGFELDSEELDNLGRYTYAISLIDDTPEEEYEDIEESTNLTIFDEADSKYDKRFKRYLYKERLRNNKEVLSIYAQVKLRNSKITKTFRELRLYKGMNVYVDTSYYHEIYLKHALKGTEKAFYMYVDFFTRLMENKEIYSTYNKITYFIPVEFTRPGQTVEEFLNWKTDLNFFSVILRLLKRRPEVLKQWGTKKFVMLGKNGYFTLDLSTFNMKNVPKLKKNISRILSGGVIEDEDTDIEEQVPDNTANVVEIIDKIETGTGIKIDDISVASKDLSHLSMEEDYPKIDIDDSTAIFILAPDSNTVISEINGKSLRSNSIHSYYKPAK